MAALLLLLVVVLVAVSEGSVPATAVRFLSVIAGALAGAAGIRVAAGPRAWGDSWFSLLESARVLERDAVPYWADELPERARTRLHKNALNAVSSIPLGLVVAGPLLLAASVVFVAFGIPRQTARLELQQGEPVEFLVSADGQRQRMQGSLTLDSAAQQDGHWVAVLTGADLSGQASRTTPLREGERWRIGDWSVQLESVAPSSLVGEAELMYDGARVILRRGAPVATSSGTLELLDGRFSFLGQLGPAALMRQTLADGEQIDEWVFARESALHERLGEGPGAMQLLELRPALSVTLMAASAGPLALQPWSAWAGVAVMGLLLALLASGGVWLRGRDGDYELVSWGLGSRRRRLLAAWRRELGLAAVSEADAEPRRWYIVLVLVAAGAAVALLAGQGRAFVLLPLIACALGGALVIPGARGLALALVGSSLASMLLIATAGGAGAATSTAWVSAVVSAAIAATGAAAVLGLITEQGARARRAAGILVGAGGLVSLLGDPLRFGSGAHGGVLEQLSVWASNDSLVIYAQRFAGPALSLALPLLCVTLIAALVVLVAPSRVGVGLTWAVSGLGLMGAVWARSASQALDTLPTGVPDAAGLQLVDRFWADGVDAAAVFTSASAPWAFVALIGAAFVAWPGDESDSVGAGSSPAVLSSVVTASLAAASLAVAQTLFRMPTSGVGLVTVAVLAVGCSVLFMHARYLRRPSLAGACAAVSLFCLVCWSLLL